MVLEEVADEGEQGWAVSDCSVAERQDSLR